MPNLRRYLLLAPRTWLAIAAACIGMSLLIGYHEEHRSAQDLLHRKVGLPDEVMIQDFAPDLHINLINRVRVLGEVAPEFTETLNVGTATDPKWVRVVPVFPVGKKFLPFIERHEGLQGSEPGNQNSEIETWALHADEMRMHAFAFAISEFADNDPYGSPLPPAGLRVLAQAEGRSLVNLSGAVVGGGALLEQISAKMTSSGVRSTPNTLLIEPTAPVPAGLLSRYQADSLRLWLSAFGIVCALTALGTAFFAGNRWPKAPKATKVQEVKASNAFPAVSFFQPIASQDELQLEEETSQSRPQSRIRQFTASALSASDSIREGFKSKNPQ